MEGGAKLYKKADEGGRQESKNTLLKFRYSEKVSKFEKNILQLIDYVGYGKIEEFISMFILKFYPLHRGISSQ